MDQRVMDQLVAYEYRDKVALPQPPESRVRRDVRFSLWRFLAGFCIVLVLAACAWPHLPRVYVAMETLVLRPTGLNGPVDPTAAMRQPLDESAVLSELDMLRLDGLVDHVIARHGLDADPEFAPSRGPAELLVRAADRWPGIFPRPQRAENRERDTAELRRNVRDHFVIDRDRRSYTFRVGFRSSDPHKAAAVAATIVQQFVDMQVERKRAILENVTAHQAEREHALRDRAGAARREILEFRIATGLIDQGARASLEAQLAALSAEAAATHARAIEATTRAQMLASMQEQGTLDGAPEVLSSPIVQQLNQSLSAAFARPTIFPAEVNAIKEQIAATRDRILVAAQAEAANWIKRRSLIEDELRDIRERLVELNKNQFRLDAMMQEAANADAAFLEALTSLRSMAAPNGLQPDVEVVSPATVPDRPAFPSPIPFGAGVLMLGVLAGAALNPRPLLRGVQRLVTG
ncbi:GumC family protein [Pseudochelatococcus lubricantis]|uniref:GumC family protein n=1 Tax=Pseudochelatococcus lubricantis TaxID=1538102 RepID=UPI0035EC2BE8